MTNHFSHASLLQEQHKTHRIVFWVVHMSHNVTTWHGETWLFLSARVQCGRIVFFRAEQWKLLWQQTQFPQVFHLLEDRERCVIYGVAVYLLWVCYLLKYKSAFCTLRKIPRRNNACRLTVRAPPDHSHFGSCLYSFAWWWMMQMLENQIFRKSVGGNNCHSNYGKY